MDLKSSPHRRYNPLAGEWIKVSPHRALRPWQGQVEKIALEEKPEHDPSCFLCPRNKRVGGEINPDYKESFVFQNDFSALLPDAPVDSFEDGLLKAEGEKGLCRVICFSPKHNLTVAEMTQSEAETVTKLWRDQYVELAAIDGVNHVQIFENKGAVMGCSNPHPHGQIWAEYRIPDLPMRELTKQKEYFERKESTLLIDYVDQELAARERVIFENESFVALVPFWAVWPFETMILPKKAKSSLAELSDKELKDLADAVRRVAVRYDNLFETLFPYSMGIHQSPTDGKERPGCQLHLHFFPPLLRSATVKKFMVGYELMAMAQRDITAEQAAERLRGMSETHFMKK